MLATVEDGPGWGGAVGGGLKHWWAVSDLWTELRAQERVMVLGGRP